jgi:polyketide-type polyunsaturated fatty acid synthase PfaA
MGSNTQNLSDTPVAIIGLAGIFAGAANSQEYWDNILNKVDCIIDVPPSRWDINDYYDPDPSVPDRTYCRRGGFIPDVDFNPMEFGLPPNTLEVTDVSQLIGLVVARDAMNDAGYGMDHAFDRDRVGVVLGASGGLKLITPLASRLQYPIWEKVLKSSGLSDEDTNRIIAKMKMAYVGWEEASFPGVLANVISGRIANRLDLGGINATTDAACASSLAAVQMAVSQLVERRCDMMITGGVDTDNSPFTFMCFSKTPAFSRRGDIRPFDADADGMLVGEGIGMAVLKRLDDAECDGDKVYAVIRGIGSSSDGRYKSIYAPRSEGQSKAMRRAYDEAGYEPQTVRLVEAHGTGTAAGDAAEFAGLMMVFADGDCPRQCIALGSVKSQIGHAKGAAGSAGMLKAALALHHKVLPPTINVTTPNPNLAIESSPFYLNTEPRPWVRAEGTTPRRAGVSAFGFGGTNFHLTLEEYASDHTDCYRLNSVAQPIILHEETPEQLIASCEAALGRLGGGNAVGGRIEITACSKADVIPSGSARLGFVAVSPDEAAQSLASGLSVLKNKPDAEEWTHPKGIHYRRAGLESVGKVVALFPGQGSQYVNMGREAVLNFPPLRDLYARMDALFIADGLKPLSEAVFPIPVFDDETRNNQSNVLRATDYAQAAIGVTSAGMFKLLQAAGFKPDFTAGHSFGELTALWAGGVLDDNGFLALVRARGKAMAPPPDPDFDAGTMLAVTGALADVEKEVTALEGVTIANQNSPNQVVLAGGVEAIRKASQALSSSGFQVTALPVSAAFHTSLVAHASAVFSEAVALAQFRKAAVPVYSNTTGDPYPKRAKAAREVLANHILHPVIFKTQIENIYEAGGRVFVEIGPRRIVTNLVDEILEGRPHVAIALNSSRDKSSDRQLRDAVVQLRVVGIPLTDIDPYDLTPGARRG